jgi:hypothetical protein
MLDAQNATLVWDRASPVGDASVTVVAMTEQAFYMAIAGPSMSVRGRCSCKCVAVLLLVIHVCTWVRVHL